ncbi:MAG: ABC transporter ATP-binding protein [Erysipelotrichales bacterium]|nr:ABC transporter ATP-binding protein [Erysipelotrichales bacterium]
MNIFKNYYYLITENHKITSPYILLSIINYATTIISPIISGKFLNTISKYNIYELYKITYYFIIVTIIQVLCSYTTNILFTKVSLNSDLQLKSKIYTHVYNTPYINISQFSPAYVANRIDNDSKTIVNFIFSHMVTISLNTLKFIIIIAILFKINKKISVTVILILIINLILYFIYKKPLFRHSHKVQEKINEYFNQQNEYFSLIKSIKQNSWKEIFDQKIEKKFVDFLKEDLDFVKIKQMYLNSNSLLHNGAIVYLMLLCGREIINHNMNIGDFIIFNTYFSNLTNVLSYFIQFGSTYQQVLVSDHRINEIMDFPTNCNGNYKIQQIDDIHIKNLTFEYNKNTVLFNKFNCSFKKSNIYAIVGDNGKGKSTMIDLLIGINNSYKGDIYYNDINLKEIDKESLKENNISIVEQNPELIYDTLFSNITAGIKNYNRTKLDFLTGLFDLSGMDLSQNSNFINKLSGGEKQKICIIRNLLKDSDLFILDEPTSALDKSSKSELINILKSIKTNKIIILITHDKDLMDIADEVIQL